MKHDKLFSTHVYLFDNAMQCTTAMEDIEYAKWLTDKPCYVGDKGPRTPS